MQSKIQTPMIHYSSIQSNLKKKKSLLLETFVSIPVYVGFGIDRSSIGEYRHRFNTPTVKSIFISIYHQNNNILHVLKLHPKNRDTEIFFKMQIFCTASTEIIT